MDCSADAVPVQISLVLVTLVGDNDIDDRKSTIDYRVYFGSNILLWSSHKQRVVSMSNTE